MTMHMDSLLLEGSSEILILLDTESLHIVAANHAAQRQLGYDAGALVGVPIGVVECALSDLFFWEEMAASHTPLGALSSYQRRDGSVFEVRKFVKRTGPNKEFYLLRARPVRQHHLESEMDVAAMHLSATLEATVDGILLVDNDGAILNMNRRFSELMALPPKLLEERDDHGILAHIDSIVAKDPRAAETPTALRQAIDLRLDLGGATLENLQLADGRVLECVSHPARNRKRTIGRVFCYRDITERVHHEQSLQEARDLAEKATASKGHFLANMSHELRTPMNAILGLLSLLQTTALTDRQRDYASKTEGAAHSLLGLLNDILDFSKVEAGRMILENEPFRIEKLMRNLSVVLSSTVGNKDVEVLFDLDASLPPVLKGDATRLQQILTNLGGNAVKFTTQGQVVLAVRNRGQCGDTATIEFSVADSGIGIAAEHQAHIFTGFSQAEASTTRRFGGTGLGLAISKRFVEMMGGDIEVTSTLGKGSTFSFTLHMPVVAEAPDALAQTLRPAPPHQRALVVDDNPIAAELTLRALHMWGWTAQTVQSGKEAIEMLSAACASTQAEFPYPVIYMDWQMPGMDGWEATRQIRQLASRHGLPQPVVIMVTAHGRESLTQCTEEEQALINGFLVKPATAALLYDAFVDAQSGNAGMRKMMRGRSQPRQLAGMRILVVEDNLINQQVAEELLANEGAIVSLAANGQQGVEAVAAAAPQFDVVLMDLQMPVLDGYGATRAIRDDLRLKNLPIVAMTANAMASDRDACLAAGMNEHIGKPFDMAQLAALLVRVVGFTAAPSSPGAAEPSPAAEPQTLPEIAGLEYQEAIGRMSGSQSLYVRTAQNFVKILSTFHDELAQLLEGQDGKAVAMALHTLKGNAGTLGLTSLAQEARRLGNVYSGDGGPQILHAELDGLKAQLAHASDLLNQALLRLQPSPAAQTVDSPAVAALSRAEKLRMLARLELLLQQSSMQTLETFAEIRDQIEDLPDGLFDRLDAAIQDLDFPSAHSFCRQAQAAWGR